MSSPFQKQFSAKSPLSQRSLGNRGAYRPANPGDLLDESVHDESEYDSTNAGKISGMKYNIENLSEIQKDKDGQFVVSLDDSEGLSSGPSGTVSNYDQGGGAVRDTLRPGVGRKFQLPIKTPLEIRKANSSRQTKKSKPMEDCKGFECSKSEASLNRNNKTKTRTKTHTTNARAMAKEKEQDK